MAGSVEVQLLGGVEVWRDGAAVPVAGAKQKAIVALLALGSPHPVSGDHLIDGLWGDDLPGHPANALQGQISNLRRLLGREAVELRGAGYLLAVGPDDVDTVRLERLVRAGREAAAAGDHAAAAQHFGAAVAMPRGPTLADVQEFAFARDAAARIDELVCAAHEGLADARLATGGHAEAVAALAGLVRTNPLRERFHAQLILALYRCGRQAEALRAFQDARRLLVEELGVEPGPELAELEGAVLRHDPSLNPPLPAREPAAPAAPAPAEPVSSRLPLVGREPELRALGEDLDQALAGRGRVAVLGGEPGIGKTRLAEELAAEAAARGATVIWGRCYEGRGAPAFWPWMQIVNGLLARFDDKRIRLAIGPGAADLAQIVPEIKEIFPGIEPPPTVDPEAAQFRLYQAVTASLRRLASAQPLVLVLDDLHWADPPSLDLLVVLASVLADVPLLVMGTYRNVDPTLGGPLADTLVELSRRSTVRRLDLAGLDRRGLERLLSAAGSVPDDDLLTTVHRRTRGNPFFATEIIRLIPGSAGDMRSLSRVVPAGVKGVIRQRVARLPEAVRPTLDVAACLGQDFDLPVLAAVAAMDGATLLDHLQPAIDAGLLIDNLSGASRYRFAHGLVSETIADDLSAGARSRVHQRIARAIEAHHGDADGQHLLALADHWFRAVPAEPPDTGVAYALRAAQWAAAHVAHQQAEGQLRCALELLNALPEGRRRASLELRVQNQISLLAIASSSYAGDVLAKACGRMRELCRELGEHLLLVPVLWRLSIHHMLQCELDSAMAVSGELLGLAGAEGEPSAVLAGNMARATIVNCRGDNRIARGHFDCAIELCDAGHDESLVALTEQPTVFSRVYSALNWWLLGEEERAEQDSLDAVTIAAEIGRHTYSSTLAVWGSSLIAMLRRDVEATFQRCDDGIALALENGYPAGVLYITGNRGWAEAASGDVAGGTATIEATLDQLGPAYLRPMFLALQADVHRMGGRFGDALASADDGLAVVTSTDERWFEAELHRLRGDALAGLDPGRPAAADAYRAAIAVATAQSAHVLRRRAEASLAAASAR